jgi:hypothetical protein
VSSIPTKAGFVQTEGSCWSLVSRNSNLAEILFFPFSSSELIFRYKLFNFNALGH